MQCSAYIHKRVLHVVVVGGGGGGGVFFNLLLELC